MTGDKAVAPAPLQSYLDLLRGTNTAAAEFSPLNNEAISQVLTEVLTRTLTLTLAIALTLTLTRNLTLTLTRCSPRWPAATITTTPRAAPRRRWGWR